VGRWGIVGPVDIAVRTAEAVEVYDPAGSGLHEAHRGLVVEVWSMVVVQTEWS